MVILVVCPTCLMAASRHFPDRASLPIPKCTRDRVQPGDRLPAIFAAVQMPGDHFLAPRAHLVGNIAAQGALWWVTGSLVGFACVQYDWRLQFQGSVHAYFGCISQAVEAPFGFSRDKFVSRGNPHPRFQALWNFTNVPQPFPVLSDGRRRASTWLSYWPILAGLML